MYRSIIIVCTYIGYTYAAPQSSIEPIETIAEVKPTTFDLPFSSYDSPPLPIDAPRVINERILDTSLDDFPFDVTTENIVEELARLADIATDNYGTITEPSPENYGSEKKNPNFYTKLSGYILKPYNMAGLNDDDTTTYVEEKPNNVEDKANYDTTGETINPTVDDNNFPDNSSEVTPKSVASKSSSINKNPSTIPNKPSSDSIKKNFGQNSIEIGENSIEIKPDGDEFKSKKIGFQPKNNLRRKENMTRQVQKAGKKKFRSKCRCEKIWNCPRLQITVPRCPNEYFMCCF